MAIKDLFIKDINRNINGVIKVEQDDYDNVYQELDEYVVTKEMDKHFHDFFSSYVKTLNDSTDKIGVWVSGFFGSGKSHFIKILSYLLANKRLNGKTSIDFFRGKFQDEMLLADIERTTSKGTSDVILFNIDSKSDALNKTDKEGIVKVFMKVFDEMQGYCGEIAWLAELEREMDKRGFYSSFKDEYKKITDQTWEENRDSFYFDRDNIVTALEQSAGMSKESAEKWFDTAQDNYTLSIEKFAKILMDYCKSKGDHRIVFLVDEIGQYIGDNTDLMLNLQTITEDLGRMLNGKAWIVVTSQEAIDTITNLKGRDFSKIKGRFSTQLNLSSENTDAVIKKRILEKNDHSKDYLTLYYGQKKAILRNLISFSADTAEMKSYSSEEEFAEVYPFIPYQFNLVQKVFEQIRRIGASGAHLSEGERSMLSAFQEAGKMVCDCDTGKLVPFSFFYRSIETFLHSGIKRTINQARDNSRLQPEDIELLKILFMIKYIKEIRPNLENLTTLSVGNIDEDKIALRKDIKSSLERLKSETLINQNGEEYEFLTDEEQDIERKIKDIRIDSQNIIEYTANIIFEDIYKEKKYKYNTFNHYPFNCQADEYNKGTQGNELTVKFLTPWNDNYSSSNFNMIMGSTDGIIIKLPDDETFLQEINKMLQIERFIRRETSSKNSETIQKIINGKGMELHKIKSRVKLLIEDGITESTFYICGNKVNIKGNNPRDIINNSLSKLVENVYSRADYIKVNTSSVDDILKILNANSLELFSMNQWQDNKLAEDDVKNFIEGQYNRSLKITIKAVKDKYTKKPYGWSDFDIAGIIAFLYAKGILRLKYNMEYVENKKGVTDYLIKKEYCETVLIEPKPVIDPSSIKNVKKIMQEAFGLANLPDEPGELMKKIKDFLYDFIQELKDYKGRYRNNNGITYPGLSIIEELIKLLASIISINNEHEFFASLIKNKNDLLDLIEDIAPVKSFFKSQAVIFDKCLGEYNRFLNDKPYLSDTAKDDLDKMDKIFNKKEPYNDIKELPLLVGKIKEEHSKMVDDYRKIVIDKIRDVIEDIRDILDKNNLKNSFSESIISYYERLIREVEGINDYTKLMAITVKIETQKSTSLRQIDDEIEKHKIPEIPEAGTVITPVKKTEQIKIGELQRWNRVIETKDQLDDYLNHLREKLEKILEQDKKIRLV